MSQKELLWLGLGFGMGLGLELGWGGVRWAGVGCARVRWAGVNPLWLYFHIGWRISIHDSVRLIPRAFSHVTFSGPRLAPRVLQERSGGQNVVVFSRR